MAPPAPDELLVIVKPADLPDKLLIGFTCLTFVKSSFELSYRFPKIKMENLRAYYPPELANRFFDTLTILNLDIEHENAEQG